MSAAWPEEGVDTYERKIGYLRNCACEEETVVALYAEEHAHTSPPSRNGPIRRETSAGEGKARARGLVWQQRVREMALLYRNGIARKGGKPQFLNPGSEIIR
jgi:hypothetical protein